MKRKRTTEDIKQKIKEEKWINRETRVKSESEYENPKTGPEFMK